MKTIRNMILLIALFLLIPFTPIHASSDVYVEDTYGALSQEEVDELNAYAAQIADQYEFGVYARIIEDPTEQSYDDMTNFIEKYYTDESLGYDNTDNGVLLLITQCSKGGSYQVYIPYCDKQSMFSLDGMDIMDSAARSGLYEHDYYSAIRNYIKEADGLMAYYSENGEHYGSKFHTNQKRHHIRLATNHCTHHSARTKKQAQNKSHRNNSTFLCTRQWRTFNKQP